MFGYSFIIPEKALQIFYRSVADICDQNNNDLEVNVMLVKAKYLFKLLLAMENMNECVDQLDILSLGNYLQEFGNKGLNF